MHIKIENLNSETVRQIAYALANGGPELRQAGEQMEVYRQLLELIAELDRRPGGDTSELKEMADYWQAGIARRYRGNPAQDGINAVKADDAARKSGAGAPGSLDTTKSPAERDALRAKGE